MIKELIGNLTFIIELADVFIITIGALFASGVFIQTALAKDPNAYEAFRSRLGKSILLGLELKVPHLNLKEINKNLLRELFKLWPLICSLYLQLFNDWYLLGQSSLYFSTLQKIKPYLFWSQYTLLISIAISYVNGFVGLVICVGLTLLFLIPPLKAEYINPLKADEVR